MPARPQGDFLPTESSLFFKLIRVVNLTARPFMEGVGKAHRLTLNEWRVMVVVASHDGIAGHEIAHRAGLDKMTVSRAIGGLQQRGRLLRHADPADGRRAMLTLSASGRKVYERVGEHGREREQQLFASLPKAQQAALGKTLDALIENLLEPPLRIDP